MSTLVLIFTIIQLLAGLFLIAVVLLQSGKSAGLSGSIAGGADTFFSKAKWVALGFVVLTLVLNLLEA